MTAVYFATNRLSDGGGAFGYGAKIVGTDASKITFAVANVSNTTLGDESSGRIDGIADKTPLNFSAATTNAIVNSGKNLLVFIHGFDNSFEDAIKRAAFNREWFASSGNVAADMTVVAFTWPSLGQLFEPPPHLPADGYMTDQAQAGKSGWHIAYFLEVIEQLRRSYKAANPAGRVILLAHSMGNYALQAGLQMWATSHTPGVVLFDAAILPAADEISDTFERPSGGRMSSLRNLCTRISIYYSRCDVAMYLSTTLNLSSRLGYDGPDDKQDKKIYPKAKFRMIDCTNATDFPPVDPPDATHQYYRRSKLVRTDIVAAIAGTASGDHTF
jgi:esterase/lipase superfamily enzyme